MTRRPKLWLALASIFTFINLGGAGFAVAGAEFPHAAVHVALAVVGTFFMWRFASRARAQPSQDTALDDARLDTLQQSLDAIALEVERIGEAQRFTAKLMSERTERTPTKSRPGDLS